MYKVRLEFMIFKDTLSSDVDLIRRKVKSAFDLISVYDGYLTARFFGHGSITNVFKRSREAKNHALSMIMKEVNDICDRYLKRECDGEVFIVCMKSNEVCGVNIGDDDYDWHYGFSVGFERADSIDCQISENRIEYFPIYGDFEECKFDNREYLKEIMSRRSKRCVCHE